jgi:hypothetical protein
VKNQRQWEDTGNTNGSRKKQPPIFSVGCTSNKAAALLDTTHNETLPSWKKGTVQPRPFRRGKFDDTPLLGRTSLATPTPSLALRKTTDLTAALLGQGEHLPGVHTLDPSTGSDDIDYDYQDMFAPFRESSTESNSTRDFMSNMNIDGDPELQIAIRKLCVKYKHIFSDRLDAKPASIPPFDLIVDKTKWESPP